MSVIWSPNISTIVDDPKPTRVIRNRISTRLSAEEEDREIITGCGALFNEAGRALKRGDKKLAVELLDQCQVLIQRYRGDL